MDHLSFRISENQVVIRLRDRICDTSERLLESELFLRVLKQFINRLANKRSKLLGIFANPQTISDEDIHSLVTALKMLIKLPVDMAIRVVPGSEQFFADRERFTEFIEQFYNYWRSLRRLIICDSEGDSFDQRPYHTFNATVETLMHVVRSTYRDIQENVTGNHPRIYRQVSAGANAGAIAIPRQIPYPHARYEKLNKIAVIRQVLIYPPMIFNTPSNTRKGMFERIYQNPMDSVDFHKEDWLCYPARVGSLLIMVYFTIKSFELGFALSNLFEVAGDEELQHKPDAVFLFGITDGGVVSSSGSKTVFYQDNENDLLVGAIPLRDEFGYFGYLKKMILTLHNIKMMQRGLLPFHGAMFRLALRGQPARTLLVMGDTGAGKSETLEAMRSMAGDEIEDLVIVADDMGSLELGPDGRLRGYGTETGAFVRLDDLQPGYALGQIDRAIIMNANQVNARVVLPVTTYAEVMRGYPVDAILYANNYEPVDDSHPVIEQFFSADQALTVFRAGQVMSKGTTNTTGLVGTYFANVFGPAQYPELYDPLARTYFDVFFKQGIFVGQMRTQLGIAGREQSGPLQSARALLDLLKTLPGLSK